MEPIHEIDLLIGKIDRGLEMRRNGNVSAAEFFDSFYFVPSQSVDREIRASEPGSEECFEAQMRLIYEPIAGHKHQISMEGLEIPSLERCRPFPFGLAPRDAGYWTMAYGFLLNTLNLPRGARVLEIGFGPGGLTELLVRAGLSLTALDVQESNCIQFTQRMVRMAEAAEVICCDAKDVSYHNEFDAIIFYEAFHHMPAPRSLLKKLKPFLKKGGIFVFGAEPIQPPGPLIPYPWGFRMNGGSLGAIRDVGWVEFGFQSDFFVYLLADLGFDVSRQFLSGYNHCDVWVTSTHE